MASSSGSSAAPEIIRLARVKGVSSMVFVPTHYRLYRRCRARCWWVMHMYSIMT